METLRAPLSLPSTRLGCHILYIVLFAFVGLTFSPWELGSLSLYYKLYDTVYNSSLFVNPFSLFWFNKRGSVATVDQVNLRERNNITSLTYLNSTLVTGWSTAGVADSNLTKVFLL